MELLIRRSDEYKLPFPLLEPETLLSDDGTTGTNSRLASDYSGSLTASQINDLETNFISSIVNVAVKSGAGAQKTDKLCSSSPEKLDSCYSVSEGEALAPGVNPNSSSGIRCATDSRLVKTDSMSMRSARQLVSYPYTIPNPMIPTNASSSRTKQQIRTGGSSGRRKKQSGKGSSHPDQDLASVNCGSKSLALSLTSGALTPYAAGYGQSDGPTIYMQPDFTSLEASLLSGSSTNTFTGHSVGEGVQMSFDQVGYYLGWRSTTDNGYLPNPNSSLTHSTPQTVQSYSTDATSRIFPQGIPGHTGRMNYTGHGEADSPYGHYGTPYDAYSAAVAAAAVVAAANSCHSTNSTQVRNVTGGPANLSSCVGQAFPRFYSSLADQNGCMPGHVNLNDEVLENPQRSAPQFPRTLRDRAFSVNVAMDTDTPVADSYDMLKPTTRAEEANISFNQYLKPSEYGDVHLASKQEFIDYPSFQDHNDKVTQSFGSANALLAGVGSANQYDPMYQSMTNYDDSFGEKIYGNSLSETNNLRHTLASSLASVNSELQTASSLLDSKFHRERSWSDAEPSRLTSEEFYFRSSGPENPNAIINRSTSSACSSSSGRSATPGTQTDRVDYSLQTSTHASASESSPRWDLLSRDPNHMAFGSHLHGRSGSHASLSEQSSNQMVRNYSQPAETYA